MISTSEGEGAEIRRPIVKATSVVEQRISHFLMGLALIGTMTGPLLTVLHTMPSAVFAGVFFIVGVSFIHQSQKFKLLGTCTDFADQAPIPTVGIHRVERHSSKTCFPLGGESLCSTRRTSIDDPKA